MNTIRVMGCITMTVVGAVGLTKSIKGVISHKKEIARIEHDLDVAITDLRRSLMQRVKNTKDDELYISRYGCSCGNESYEKVSHGYYKVSYERNREIGQK